MSLFNRLKGEDNNRFDGSGAVEPTPTVFSQKNVTGNFKKKDDDYQDIKSKIHRLLIDNLDLTVIESIPRDKLQQQIREIVSTLLIEEGDITIGINKDRLVEEILNEVFGLGPIEPLVNDPSVSDILVNTHNQVFVERFGRLSRTNITFNNEDHLLHIIDRIVSQVGRRIDESSPMVDARLNDGSRVNAIIRPLAIDGPMLSIRKFSVQNFSMQDLISNGTLSAPMGEILSAVVKARLNVLISGGTGSGKTTLLNVLSAYIPSSERIITIEDAAELKMQQTHVVRLETRPANVEGKGKVTQRELLINALRMRPDRIIIGEVRGAEALDMLQAMNTGHDGSMTTLHANNPRDALRRLETMILMAGTNLPDKAMREQISSAINLVVQITRFSDGTRRIVNISELTGMEGDVITMQDVFVFEKMGIDEDGKIIGYMKATGIWPKFADRLKVSGIPVPEDVFQEKRITPEDIL